MIDIIGAGAWGTALTICLSDQHYQIKLITRTKKQANEINLTKSNHKYFPEYKIPNNVVIGDLSSAKVNQEAKLAIICLPTSNLREFFSGYCQKLTKYNTILIASKGIELNESLLTHQLAAQFFKHAKPKIAIISGPSFANELIKKKPAALTIAAKSLAEAQKLANTLSRKHLRIYPSDDLNGVAAAGALKNVLALASGICDGLELGENARAALLTRGLYEIGQLIQIKGGRLETTYGLAGVGDIILTCVSQKSRNYRAGLGIGKTGKVGEVIKQIGTVEGINTTLAINKNIIEHNLTAPICRAIFQIINNQISAKAAADELMNRPIRQQEN